LVLLPVRSHQTRYPGERADRILMIGVSGSQSQIGILAHLPPRRLDLPTYHLGRQHQRGFLRQCIYRLTKVFAALMDQGEVFAVVAPKQILLPLSRPIDRSRDARQPPGYSVQRLLKRNLVGR